MPSLRELDRALEESYQRAMLDRENLRTMADELLNGLQMNGVRPKYFICNDCDREDYNGSMICPYCKSRSIKVIELAKDSRDVISITDDEIPF